MGGAVSWNIYQDAKSKGAPFGTLLSSFYQYLQDSKKNATYGGSDSWSKALTTYFDNTISSYGNYNGKSLNDYARTATDFNDFLNQSGINTRAKNYDQALANTQTQTNNSMNNYADAQGGAAARGLLNSQKLLEGWFNDTRQKEGTIVSNADAGAVYTGNTSGNTSSGGNASSGGNGDNSSSGTMYRAGGESIIGDAMRTDRASSDSLLGAYRSELNQKEKLF